MIGQNIDAEILWRSYYYARRAFHDVTLTVSLKNASLPEARNSRANEKTQFLINAGNALLMKPLNVRTIFLPFFSKTNRYSSPRR